MELWVFIAEYHSSQMGKVNAMCILAKAASDLITMDSAFGCLAKVGSCFTVACYATEYFLLFMKTRDFHCENKRHTMITLENNYSLIKALYFDVVFFFYQRKICIIFSRRIYLLLLFLHTYMHKETPTHIDIQTYVLIYTYVSVHINITVWKFKI